MKHVILLNSLVYIFVTITSIISCPGITVTLNYPYSREIDEQHLYTEVQHHAVTRMINPVEADSDSDSCDTPSTDSCEGDDCLRKRLQQITPVSVSFLSFFSVSLSPFFHCFESFSLSLSFL